MSGSPSPAPSSTQDRSDSPLLKILGLGFGIAVAVGTIIGAGILRTPGSIAGWLPNPWLFVGIWVIGGCYAALGANALSELGTMLPRSGAQYVYAKRAFGDFPAFVVGWMDWVSTVATVAAVSIVIGESIVAVWTAAANHATAVACVIVAIFTALLLGGSRLGDRTQQLTSAIKAIALIALITACFVVEPSSAPPSLPGDVSLSVSGFAGFILAAQSVIYAYDGWTGPLYFSEELDDPGRQIPRSMFGSLIAVAAIYLLINAAFIHVVPPRELAGSSMAAATVAQRLFGQRGELIVRLVVIAALPSTVNACLLEASRVLYAMGRDGLSTRAATRVSGGGAPSVALIISGATAVAFLLAGGFDMIIAIAAFFFVANYTLSFLGVFVLRRREPDVPRPYRARGHPWTTGLVLLGSLAFLGSAVASDTRNSLYALGMLVVSYPAFLAAKRLAGGPLMGSATPYVSEES